MTTTQHTTQHDTTRVTIPVQVDRTDLLRSLMGSEWQTYEWWRSVIYEKGCDWTTYPDDMDARYVVVGIADPLGDEDDYARVILRALSLNDLLNATAQVLSVSPYMRWDDLDAEDGDAIMQVAMLGEITYG